ncbi:HAD-superhydrolase, subIIB family protein [Xylaria cf. heliscus]|nr:HAD-superhydrolase, subIIB family protein [Xylaria cf. heliscus]
MISLVVFGFDGVLVHSNPPQKYIMSELMGNALADLLSVAHVAVISVDDWPQFGQQITSSLPEHADLSKLWLMPMTGTKIYAHRNPEWVPVFDDSFTDGEKEEIVDAFYASLNATGVTPEEAWGECIEDHGSQITFSPMDQQPSEAMREQWRDVFSKRRIIQADFCERLPGRSISIGPLSINITKEDLHKVSALRRLSDLSGIPLEHTMFIENDMNLGGDDYPIGELGVETVPVRNPGDTVMAIAAIVACLC